MIHQSLTPTQHKQNEERTTEPSFAKKLRDERIARQQRFAVAARPEQSTAPKELLIAKEKFEQARADLNNAMIAIDHARMMLRMSEETHGTLSIRNIVRVVASHFELLPSDILSDIRTKDVAFARQVAMYLAKTITPMSYPEIGRRLGGRDHTTILHGYRKICVDMEADASLRKDIEGLERKLKSEAPQ